MTKELVITKHGEIDLSEGRSISTIFEKNLVDTVIENVTQKVEEFEADVTTKEGRDKIRKFAHNIAKTKTALDKAGFEMTEESRKKVSIINADRKKIKEKFDALKNKARKELTDYEDAEKERIKIRQERIAKIKSMAHCFSGGIKSDFYKDQLLNLDELTDFDWMEFKDLANKESENSRKYINLALEDRLKVEDAERIQAAEKKRLEKEAQIKRDAEIAEKARKEAEKAAAVAAAAEKERIEKKAAAEKAAAEKAIADAKAEAKRKEKEASDAIKKAEQDKKDAEAAEIKAKADAKIARIKAEKDKAKAIAKATADAEAAEKAKKLKAEQELAARKADKEHRGRINREAFESLVAEGINENQAVEVVKLIAKGLVKNISIKY